MPRTEWPSLTCLEIRFWAVDFLYCVVTKLDANVSTVINAVVLLKKCQGELLRKLEVDTTSAKTAREDDSLLLYVTKANADFL
jgi:hypothetical protein